MKQVAVRMTPEQIAIIVDEAADRNMGFSQFVRFKCGVEHGKYSPKYHAGRPKG